MFELMCTVDGEDVTMDSYVCPLDYGPGRK